MRDYNTVKNTSSHQIIIEKSKFIGHSFHIDSVEEAESIIKSTKKQYYDATHNCYAYLLNDDMSIAKASDDGEPSSTAGMPMLDFLKKENITNTLVIVTRYFGGIKLGTGGLVRAYTQATRGSIEQNIILQKRVYSKIEVRVDYNFTGKIQKFIENKNIISDPPIFMQDVCFAIYEKEEYIETLKTDIIDMTNANCSINQCDLCYLDFIDNKYVSKG